jgi:hypothetical protein
VNGPYSISRVFTPSSDAGVVPKVGAVAIPLAAAVVGVGVCWVAVASCCSLRTPFITYPVTQKFNAKRMTQIRAYVVLTWVNELFGSQLVCSLLSFIILLLRY